MKQKSWVFLSLLFGAALALLAACNMPVGGRPVFLDLTLTPPAVSATSTYTTSLSSTPLMPPPLASTAVENTPVPLPGTGATPPAGAFTPIPDFNPTATPTVPSGPRLPARTSPVQFPGGTESTVINTRLTAGEPQAFRLQIANGQSLYVTKNGEASVTLYGPGGELISEANSSPGPWGGPVPHGGMYYLVLDGAGKVTVGVYVPEPRSTNLLPAPVPAHTQKIQFAPGTTGQTIALTMTQGVPVGYTLYAGPDRTLYIAGEGNVTVTVFPPSRVAALKTTSPQPGEWQAPLNETGNYLVVLLGKGTVRVTFTIPASP